MGGKCFTRLKTLTRSIWRRRHRKLALLIAMIGMYSWLTTTPGRAKKKAVNLYILRKLFPEISGIGVKDTKREIEGLRDRRVFEEVKAQTFFNIICYLFVFGK